MALWTFPVDGGGLALSQFRNVDEVGLCASEREENEEREEREDVARS